MRNIRLTFGAAVATMASCLSLVVVLQGVSWLMAGIGAVAVVAIAGSLSRMATVRAALIAAGALAIASIPLLAGHGWPGRLVALVLVAVAALGATGKRLPRAFAVLATYYSGLFIYLNMVFASAASYARLIPSPSSAAVLTGLPSKAAAQFKYSPPVPAGRAVDFFAAAGIGIVAIMVDIVAVRLRRPALAGLPLLVLFSVPVASDLKSFGAAQSLTFAAALAGYLGLLSADGRQRLRLWGRLVTVRNTVSGEDGQGPDTRDLAATGRRIGLAAVCLAILVPLAIPAKPHDIFAKTPGGGGGAGSGQTSSDVVSPLLTVQRQLSLPKAKKVLAYRTGAIDPPEQYLQQWVLNYDQTANQWRPVADGGSLAVRGDRLPAKIPGLSNAVPASTVKSTVTVYVADSGPLPVPYAPIQIAAHGVSLTEGSGTLMVIDTSQQQTNLQYVVTSREVAPTSQNLTVKGAAPPQIGLLYGAYNGPDATRLAQIAARHTKNAANQLQEAVDLQNWLTSRYFSYSLKPSFSDNGHWLLQFLTSRPRGDCEQFAWAFAVLARLVGIPSRIAVGYTAGSPTSDGSYQVTTANAHAWPELYFPTVGWTRFEPTPGGTSGQDTAVPPLYTSTFGGGRTVSPTPGPTQSTQSGSGHGKNSLPSSKLRQFTDNGGTGNRAGSSAGFNAGIAVAIVVFLLLVAPSAGRWLTRRRRWMTASSDAALASAAWRELLDSLTDYGHASMPSESPRGLVARIASEADFADGPREALRRIGTAEERARYSRLPRPGAGLRADVATVRRALTANSSMGQRVRAQVLPPSTMARVTSALQSVGHATSWIDSGLPSIGRRRTSTAA